MDKSRNWKIRGPHTHQGSRTCQAAAQIPLQRGTCYQLWAPFQQSLATKQARPWSEGLGVCVDTRLLSLAVIALELVTGQCCGPTVPSAQSRLLPFLSFFLLPVLFPNRPFILLTSSQCVLILNCHSWGQTGKSEDEEVEEPLCKSSYIFVKWTDSSIEMDDQYGVTVSRKVG